jgi:isopenicillin-N N-acyltransferase like protein
MRLILTCLLFAQLLNGARATEVFPVARSGKGELRYIESIPVAILVGSPAEIGAQHAALLAKPGAEVLAFPKRMFTEIGIGFFYPLAAQAGKTLMLNAPERYQQEVAATNKQAQLEPEVLAVGNTLLELRRIGCSALIVEGAKSSTGRPLFGRNFDFPAFGLLDRYGVVTVTRPEGRHAFVSVGFPGLIGVLSGMNDAGLCLGTLDVEETVDGSRRFDPSGVPLALVFRQILEECTTVAEAEVLLKRTHATTQANLAVCDRENGAIFEITPKQVGRRDPQESLLTCTNHFRLPGLAVNEECWRYDRLQAAGVKQTLSVADIQNGLDQSNQGELTLQTMVFEPNELVLHLAMGTPPSSQHKMHRLELRELLSPSK